MKKSTVSLVAILATLSLSSPVFAAGDYHNSTSMNHNKEMRTGHSRTLSADDLLGMTIESKDGKNIGEIQDIQIDPNNGRIDFVTVQVGGVLGIGGKDGVPVPLEAFNFADNKAKLTVDQSKLNGVPDRANLSDEEFRRDLQSHYGISPAWEDNQTRPTSGGDSMDRSNRMNTDMMHNMDMDSGRDSSNMMKTQ